MLKGVAMGTFATRHVPPLAAAGRCLLLAISLAIPAASAWAVPDTAARDSQVSNITQASAAGIIAVIYPDVGEPYRRIFEEILDGIRERTKGRFANFAVGVNMNIGQLNNALRRQNTKVVIALGRQGILAATALDSTVDVVVGGILTATESDRNNFQVNSLSPDPDLLFSNLKEIMPRARRVFVVYDPRQNAWMIRLARKAARSHGLDLEAYAAQDLRSAIRAYQEILATTDGKQDAIWLPQDSTTVEDSAVLPMVLQKSWLHNLAVFSSSYSHTKRGALFALYPDHTGLGRKLAGTALGFSPEGESEPAGIRPLREVLLAVNSRTARHLGLSVDSRHAVDLAVPAP